MANLVLAVLLLVLAPSAYWVGFQQGRAVLPRMPTDGTSSTKTCGEAQSDLSFEKPAITRDAVKLELKYLDDEFHVELEENKKFKGLPRPELDEAWEDVTAGIHIRVPHDVAVETNFTSLELADGSGDSWGTPAVFHNLHCLVGHRPHDFWMLKTDLTANQRYIRQAQFPEKYPLAWKFMKPQPNGAMSEHFDHCLDK